MKRFAVPFAACLMAFLSAASPAQTGLSPSDQKALAELETEVTGLKREVFDAKSRVHQLEEAVLRGRITGSKALIRFENQAEGFFNFSSAEFYVDGQLVHKLVRAKTAPKSVTVFDSNLPSGEHSLKARISYKGSDKSVYSMFPYFKDHIFEVETVQDFEVEYGKTTLVKLVASDRGYFKTDVRERLAVQFQVLRNWGTE